MLHCMLSCRCTAHMRLRHIGEAGQGRQSKEHSPHRLHRQVLLDQFVVKIGHGTGGDHTATIE